MPGVMSVAGMLCIPALLSESHHRPVALAPRRGIEPRGNQFGDRRSGLVALASAPLRREPAVALSGPEGPQWPLSSSPGSLDRQPGRVPPDPHGPDTLQATRMIQTMQT